MTKILLFSILAITFALIFYTIGVWAEHKDKVLKKWHVIIFWFGLVCDTLGTSAMTKIAKSNSALTSTSSLGIHGITGGLAIILMLFHALWASWALFKGNEKTKQFFHKFSLVVWLIWLIPYFIGAFMGMSH